MMTDRLFEAGRKGPGDREFQHIGLPFLHLGGIVRV